MNGFQITILGIFIAALIIGVLIFAGVLPGFRAPSGGAGGAVLWWGTIPTDTLQPVLEKIQREHRDDFTLNYVEKSPDMIENDLLEALALGHGPDLVTLTSDTLLRQTDKLQAIPYTAISKQNFQNTFVLGTSMKDWELFFSPSGVVGLPLYVNPLVLYYNQDLIANAKLPSVPHTWKELAEVTKLLTQTDSRGNISQATIALGTFNNINQAKELLAFLLLQSGNPIVARDEANRPVVTLKDAFGFNKQPAGEATGFFLRFVDPANTLYSWNSSQLEARESFVRGKLALYLGFGSELKKITAQNPQLNFALTLPPQREGGGREVTLGHFSFLAIPRGAKNPNTALQVAELLTNHDFDQLIATAVNLPPARNDLLRTLPSDPNLATLYQAAIIARDWLDPAPDKTKLILRRMVEAIALGQVDPPRAIGDADASLEKLLPQP